MVGVGILAETVTKLADRLIQLGKERRDSARNYFTNRIEPLYKAIDSAHESYVRTFTDYTGTLSSYALFDGCPPLFQQIERDMMLTRATRMKVETLRLHVREPEAHEFRTRIGGYIRCAAGAHRLDRLANAPRLALLAELDTVLHPGQPRDEFTARRDYIRGRRVIERRLRQLDEKFGAVYFEYERLREHYVL